MSPCTIMSPAELVAAVPVILGFHPTNSLVALWTDEDSRLVWSMRFDLEAPEPIIARTLLGLITRHGKVGRLMLVVYPPTRDCPPTVEVLRDRLARNDVDVLDALLVSDGRWWSMLCTSTDCCPPGGHQVSEVVSELEVSRIVEGAPAQRHSARAYVVA